MKKGRVSAFWRKRQYVIAGAVVAIAAVGMTVLYSNSQEKERQQLEQQMAQEMQQELAAKEEESEAEEVSSVLEPKAKEEETKEVAEVAKEVEDTATEEVVPEVSAVEPDTADETTPVAAKTVTLHFAPEEGIIWPLEGNVLINYSMDATVYFATLDQYKYNPAVVIQGNVNSKVLSVAKGKITSIEDNEVTGCTVAVDLGDGYQAIYGQLKEVNFDVGDYVEAGHVIGYVSEPTKYFSVEGSNLYFELQKDGEPIDPIAYFE